MALSEDKHWAAKYLLDPLNAPDPSAETGPGTSFGNTMAPRTASPKAESLSKDSTGNKKTSYLSKRPSAAGQDPSGKTSSKSSGYPTPPGSASPRQAQFDRRSPSIRQEVFGSKQAQRTQHARHQSDQSHGGFSGRRRTSSLTGRYPGDQSHRPLEQLKHENKLANRSPHLKKRHIPGADSIDNLDTNPIGPAYHHEGPFDATLLARNITPLYSPVGALSGTNAEALRATPKDNIQDSLLKHRPLYGTSSIPSGMKDFSGNRMEYEEGADLMIEDGGNYKRWAGVTYLPEDLKGKGEPSYSIEKAMKDSKAHRRVVSDGNGSYEMVSGLGRSRSSSGTDPNRDSAHLRYRDWEQDIRRSGSERKGFGEGLKRRLSFRKRA